MKIAIINVGKVKDNQKPVHKPHGNVFDIEDYNLAIKKISSYNEVTEVYNFSDISDYADFDWFFFCDFFRVPLEQLNIYKRLIHAGYASKMVYIMQEPESVISMHAMKRYKKILEYFHYILTYNDEMVDNIRVFRIPIPYNFSILFDNYNRNYTEKKLLTNISGYHVSKCKQELYSERQKVIDFFEEKHVEDFDFFGAKWNNAGRFYGNYKGKVENKFETYQNYRFALCLENNAELSGYITEKILDCFKARIVPIYKGAKNICCYIPADTFINYDDFENIEKLYEYIANMPNEKYMNYINAIDRFMKSDEKNFFSIDNWAHMVVIANENMKKNSSNFSISNFVIYKLNIYYFFEIVLKKRVKKLWYDLKKVILFFR